MLEILTVAVGQLIIVQNIANILKSCTTIPQSLDIMKVDLLLIQKISKCHFLRDIEKSFQEVTPMSLEPHLFFLFKTSQQIWLLEPSKVLAKMGCGWQADWATAKILLMFTKRRPIVATNF